MEAELDPTGTIHLSKDVFKPEIKVCLLNQWKGAVIENFPIIKEILEETHRIKIVKDNSYDLVIDGVFSSAPIANNNSIKIFFTGEAKTPKIKGYDLSLGFDFLESSKNYVRMPLYYTYFTTKVSTEYTREGTCTPNKPYFACFLVSNSKSDKDGVLARNDMFHALSEYKFVASGGKGFNNLGRKIPHEETNNFLSQCKFTIAYENTKNHPGYITEKLFQAYYAGSVPLYYSDKNAQKDANPDAFISEQNFNSREEMIEFIKQVDQDDNKYCRIWNSKISIDSSKNYEAIKDKVRKVLRPEPKAIDYFPF